MMNVLILTMTLEVAITLGNSPTIVSYETIDSLQLDGEWEGTFQHSLDAPIEIRISFKEGKFSSGTIIILEGIIRDEGEGKFRMIDALDDLLGLYRQEGDRIVICYKQAERGRPVSLRPGVGQDLLILHRIGKGVKR